MNKHIHPLTSLRFFAALAVFFYHIPTLHQMEEFKFAQGYIGVGFFFILSGFVLAYNYHEKFKTWAMAPLLSFYKARFARVYPVHILTFSLCLPLLAYRHYFYKSINCVVVFFLNLFLLQSYFPKRNIYLSYNQLSWTISDEFFFYFLMPLVLVALYKIRMSLFKALILIIMTWAAAWAIIHVSIGRIDDKFADWLFYFSPFFRVTDFLIGIFLFFVYLKTNQTAKNYSARFFTLLEVAVLLLLAAAFLYSSKIHHLYLWGVYFIPFMVPVIFVFALSSGEISKALSLKPFVLLGEISFSFYMFHNLIMWYLNAAWGPFFHSHVVLGVAMALGLVLIVSHLCYRYFEIPMRDHIRTIPIWRHK